ncbi:MAG TPA: response regulator [Candidatus Microsaccharimonas sp.]|jgi:CheY-like chemotaxis protein
MAKILLVEDDKSLREIYGVRLMAEGYTIISAGDGEEALAVAIKERPDLIVSDVMMPKISGFDMLDILRSTTETKDIKVIMMTALSSEDQRARGEALGADRYLVKSQVGIEDVVRTVHDVLGDGIPSATTPEAIPAPVAAPVLTAEPVPATPFIQPVAAIPTPVPEPLAPAPVAVPAFEPTPQPVVVPTPIEAPFTPPVAPIAPEPLAPVAVVEPVLTPAPVAPAPFVPAPAAAPVAPAFSPAPAPVIPTPTPVIFPPSVTLPEPTAPFSSDPPASLGDRIINPLPSATDLGGAGVADIATQMNQELNAHLQNLEQPAAPIVPTVETTPSLPPTQYAIPPQPPIPPLPQQPGI